MSINHNWQTTRTEHRSFINGQKTLEVRIKKQDIKIGDTVTFWKYSDEKFHVVRVVHYNSFDEMFEIEEPTKAIIGATKSSALETYKKLFPKEKLVQGFYVYELKSPVAFPEFYRLSSLINDRDLFMGTAQSIYDFSAHLSANYPTHSEWFWKKQLPRVLDGTGEILVSTLSGKIVALAFLKKDNSECKICTLLLSDNLHQKRISERMFSDSFNFLGTSKPIFAIPEYTFPTFKPMISKYKWKLVEKSNSHFVFNSNL